MSATTPELRPLGVGEILDASFKVYKSQFKTLALCVLVPAVPLVILGVLVQSSLSEDPFDPDAAVTTGYMAGGLISLVIAMVLTMLATGACTRAIAGAYLGEEVSWQESLRAALTKLLPLIGAAILASLAGMAGLLLFVIPGIYIFFRLAIVAPILIIENRGASASLARSWGLVGGRWWATFGVIVITTLIAVVIAGLLQGLVVVPIIAGTGGELVAGILTGLAEIISYVFTLPLQAAAATILYFDLRVRKEGFDLQLLSENFGGPTASGRDAFGDAGAEAVVGVGGLQGVGGLDASRNPGGSGFPQARHDGTEASGDFRSSDTSGGFGDPRREDEPEQGRDERGHGFGGFGVPRPPERP